MEKREYSYENENMGLEGGYFEFLHNLKDENPWDERDFNSVFMYL
ncbi:MAG: hypothetical protein K0R09_131 [Clostridiales bacterium]|jgi:hypothetical protein|nr:hypothetical protein [Clostridiales bacterium]